MNEIPEKKRINNINNIYMHILKAIFHQFNSFILF
jgi:hypothetical protein